MLALAAALMVTGVPREVAPLASLSQPVTELRGDDLAGFAAALRDAGYRVKEGVGLEGGRYLEASTGGVTFSLSLSDCELGAGCAGLDYVAWWPKPSFADARIFGEWNRRLEHGQAALDEEDNVILEYRVSLGDGVPRTHFLDGYRRWTLLVRDFRAFLEEKEGRVRASYDGLEGARGVAAVNSEISG